MTTAAKVRRMQAVKLADALNAIEGVPVSDYAKALSLCWANGELTGEQMRNVKPPVSVRRGVNSL